MFLNLILLFALFYKRISGVTEALIDALIVWTVKIYVFTLVFSAFNALTYISIMGMYILTDLILLSVIVTHKRDYDFLKTIYKLFFDWCNNLKNGFSNGELSAKINVILTVLIVGYVMCLGIVVCFAVPYNYDSIMYHAPRVRQWVQNKSVFYYASHVTRQNVSTVLESYISTFLFILWGKNDSALCIIQYLSYIINLFFISAICKRQNVNDLYLRLAQILWITLPIGFAEAITPMNDHLAATWLLAFVIVLFDTIYGSHISGKNVLYPRVVIMALLIGLAYITKPSVCVGMVVFLIIYLIFLIRDRVKVNSIIIQCFSAISIIALMCSPQWVQNYRMLGKITADNVGSRQLIGTLKPNYVLMNFTKNIAYNYAFSIGGISNTEIIKKTLYSIANVLKVQLNDPSISEDGAAFYYPTLPCYSSDAALNFVLTICIGISFVLLFVNWKKMKGINKSYYLASVGSYFVFLSMLRWESSITRYLIGYYALIIPAVVLSFQIFWDNKNGICNKIFIVGISALLLVETIGEVVFLVQVHPVMGTKSNLAMYNDRIDEFLDICNYVNRNGVDKVGLIESECGIEYPLWNMLDENIAIYHVNIAENNASHIYEDLSNIVNMIISQYDLGNTTLSHGKKYDKVLSNRSWYLYELNDEK